MSTAARSKDPESASVGTASRTEVELIFAKIADGQQISQDEAEFAEAHMPRVAEADLVTVIDVSWEKEAAYLRGELAEDPCRSA
jgi:hypothetical protein